MNGESWHLDRRLPVAIIVALVMQSAGAVWWASKIDAKQDALESRLAEVETTNRRQYDRMNSERIISNNVSNRLSRMEGTLVVMGGQMDRLTKFLMEKK